MPRNERTGWRIAAIVCLALAVLLAVLKEGVMTAGPVELTPLEKKDLLALARASLRAHVEGTPPPAIDESSLSPALREEAACFVTLTNAGALRGCILDSFQPHESVARNVARNVVLAATVDSRFDQIRRDELDRLSIEISVLGKSYAIPHSPPDRLTAALRPRVDGVTLRTSFGTSTYLPQVWEQLPDVELFLSELCRKHGAPASCWRTKDLLRVEVYQVNHFSEADTE
jgi:hypothetical protein